MLFVKKCQSAFQARGKKADTSLPRQERQYAEANGAAREYGRDTLQMHAFLTSGSFPRNLLAPHGHEHLSKELEDKVLWGLSGVKGSIPNQLLQKKGNQVMSEPGSSINMTRTAPDTEETHPG